MSYLLLSKVDITPSIKTDHSAIFLELEEIESSGRGAGFWKLDTSLLANENYKHMVTNNLPTWLEAGTLSASFEINRGVRQGDPLSPYLFIIAIELLAVAIRSCSEINGIKTDSKEFKMVQYADNLTAFVSDIRSAQYLFKLLDQFEKFSGPKVNYTKTEAMWIGSSRNNTETPLALK